MTVLKKNTPFRMVAAMNEAFGNPKGDPRNIGWNRLRRQVFNISEELDEATAAIQNRDLNETRDALCDIMVFALGAFHFMGIDADEDMEAVVEGVMTRLIQTTDQLTRTAAKYDALAVKYYIEGSLPTMCLKSSEDQRGLDGKDYPKGKFLKCVDFRETQFHPY